MSKKVLKFTLEVEVDVDGKKISSNKLNDRFIDALNAVFPSVAFDDDDCSVFVNSWIYEPRV